MAERGATEEEVVAAIQSKNASVEKHATDLIGAREELTTVSEELATAKKVVPSSDELERWETRIRHSMINAEEYRLDQQSVLLFFAEYCFQTARS